MPSHCKRFYYLCVWQYEFHLNLFDALGQQVSIVREAGAIDDEQEDWLVVGQGDAVILRVQVVDGLEYGLAAGS